MGCILWGIVLAGEAALLVWDERTSFLHKRALAVGRLAALAAFFVFALCGVIAWSMRYYVFALVLCIGAADDAVRLVRKTPDAPLLPRKKISHAMRTVAACLAFGLALAPAMLFPQRKTIPVTGSETVCTATASYTDENRLDPYAGDGSRREVNVEFWYPENGENCPLVLFSHGTNGIKNTNVTLFRELASHGYVVCSIDHPYESFFTRDAAGKVTVIDAGYQQEYREATETTDLQICYAYVKKRMDIRTADMQLVLDAIAQKKDDPAAETWYHEIDMQRIAAAGHSLGGSAALTLGRKNTAVRAVVALESPYMGDIIGVDTETQNFTWEEAAYPVPVLNFYSDSTWGQWDESPLYAENTRALKKPAGRTRNLYLAGAGHLDMTDLSQISPALAGLLNAESGHGDNRAALETINAETLAFLDYWVKGEGTMPDMH